MECRICCHKYTKVGKRKKFKCPECDLSYCLACLTNFNELGGDEITCLNCSAAFDVSFLRTNTSRIFMKTVYEKKRKDFLFAEQMSHCPVTGPFIECLKRKRCLAREMDRCWKQINMEKSKLQKLHSQMGSENHFYGGKIQKTKVNARVCTDARCNGVLQQDNAAADILALPLKCTSCSRQVCSRCAASITSSMHECDPDDLESLRVIEKECKRCPRCGVNISLTQGCSQMFCTRCHAAFDWRNLQTIENGDYFHNPYYEMFRHSNGGRSRDNVFRDTDVDPAEISFSTLENKLVQTGTGEEYFRYIKGFLYFANELLAIHGTDSATVFEMRTRHARVLFMMNEISEEKFRQIVYLSEQKFAQRDALAGLLREYALFTRSTLAAWAKRDEMSHSEAISRINEKFADTQRAASQVAPKNQLTTNNHVPKPENL